MRQQIESFIEDLGSNKKIFTFDKASTKQAIVLRLLSLLEWDIFNVQEVCPDYSVDSYTVSYALLVKGKNKACIEVKRVDEKLDNHQKNLVAFAAREGVDLCVLTNGVEWRFYLIPAEGEWQQKWFHSMDLLKQKPDSIAPQLIDLLNKDNVSKGQALKAAKALYQGHKQKIAAEFVPQAWNQIISQPNKILVELLSEYTDQLCGHKIESSQIEKFVKKHLDKWLINDMRSLSSTPSDNKIEAPTPEDEPTASASIADQVAPIKKRGVYEGKSIKSFTFDGRTYEVRHWEEVLTTLCNHFANTHKKDFDKVLWISGQYTAYFSRNEEQLYIPEKIKKTDIYVETKLNPDEIVKTARLLLTEFGYSQDMLMITAE
jgi:hypothetical protein